MIYDTLESAERYCQPGTRLGRALAWLAAGRAAGLDKGRHEIEGDELFALVQEYDTRPAEACRWEAHRKYIDVQCLLQGEECVDWTPLSACALTAAFDEAKDFQACEAEEALALPLRPGRFLVLFPGDAHRACRALASPAPARKVVLKVRVD